MAELTETIPRDEAARSALASWSEPPEPAEVPERVFEHRFRPSTEPARHVRNARTGFELLLSWGAADLPRLHQWVDPRPSYYGFALEPANCSVLGRAADGAAGTLPLLEPGATRETWLESKPKAEPGNRPSLGRPLPGRAVHVEVDMEAVAVAGVARLRRLERAPARPRSAAARRGAARPLGRRVQPRRRLSPPRRAGCPAPALARTPRRREPGGASPSRDLRRARPARTPPRARPSRRRSAVHRPAADGERRSPVRPAST